MSFMDPVLREVVATQRSAHDTAWAQLNVRLLTEFGLSLSPESYRQVARRVEQEVLPTVPAALEHDTRELIRSLIQDAQYFAWLQHIFGEEWHTYRGQGHPRLGDLRGRFERDRGIPRSPYAYPYADLPRLRAGVSWEAAP